MLRLPPHNTQHATFMQPFQCDLAPQLQETQRTTHTGTTIVAKHIEGTKRPQPQPPHTRGTFHRRLQPLYTEKHEVSCSGFLPTTHSMQHSCSHSNAIWHHSFKKENYAHRNNHCCKTHRRNQTTPAATAAHTRYLPSPAAATLHGKTQGFVLRLPPQLTTCLRHRFPSSPLPFLTTPLHRHFPSSPLPFLTTSHRHRFPSSPVPFLTTPLHHRFPSSPLPFLTTSHRHHFPSSPLPFLTTSLRHHFPSSPLLSLTTPFVTTPLHHHFPSSPLPPHHFPSSPPPFLTTSLPHHPPSSSLPFFTTSLPHHFPSSPLPFLTTSLPPHFPLSPLSFLTTSLPHHFPSSPPCVIASYSFVMYC